MRLAVSINLKYCFVPTAKQCTYLFTGLSYSTWICIDKFSDPRTDPHCVRLLTLVRNLQGRDEHLVCLAVVLSARDKAIIISTQETLMPQSNYFIHLLL